MEIIKVLNKINQLIMILDKVESQIKMMERKLRIQTPTNIRLPSHVPRNKRHLQAQMPKMAFLTATKEIPTAHSLPTQGREAQLQSSQILSI